EKCPQHRLLARKLIGAFGNSCECKHCKQFFLIIKNNKSKYRTRLTRKNILKTLSAFALVNLIPTFIILFLKFKLNLLFKFCTLQVYTCLKECYSDLCNFSIIFRKY